MIKAILFDFDGVLIDSRKATVEYFQETLRHFGYPVPKEEDFESLLGLKTIDITKKLLPGIPEKKILPVFEYSKKMSLKVVPKITLFPSAKETLEKLHSEYQIALVTSRGKRTVEILFERYQLAPYFEVVIDREDVKKHKPDPEGVNTALKRLNVSPDESIYIGDSKEDVEVARNAKIRCVLIPRSNKNFGPDYQIKHLAELPKLLREINE